jgi:receptor protein-tyrosine kinase
MQNSLVREHEPQFQEGASEGSARPIGSILIESGRLSFKDAERVLRLQKEHTATGLRFGEAAIRLGLATPDDIKFALARQYGYPYLVKGDGKVSEELVAAYQPFGPQVESLRALRSQLMLRWFTGQPERRALAVVSPDGGEGRSRLAANLAVLFSQLGTHTLLIDADMRNPRQHELFNMGNRAGLSTILSGRGEGGEVFRVPSFLDLSVLPAGPLPPNPAELLGRPLFGVFLDDMRREFDVILIDTPAAADYADAQMVCARAHGAVLAVHKHITRLAAAGELCSGLSQLGVGVVGSVLSEF